MSNNSYSMNSAFSLPQKKNCTFSASRQVIFSQSTLTNHIQEKMHYHTGAPPPFQIKDLRWASCWLFEEWKTNSTQENSRSYLESAWKTKVSIKLMSLFNFKIYFKLKCKDVTVFINLCFIFFHKFILKSCFWTFTISPQLYVSLALCTAYERESNNVQPGEYFG